MTDCQEVHSNSSNNNSKISPSLHHDNLPQYTRSKFLKLLSQIWSNNFTPILNYLDLWDLARLRGVNKLFMELTHEYYKTRLNLEIEFITSFQEQNEEKTEVFMKNIDSQIPISNSNWWDFQLSSATNKILLLDKTIVSQLRSIKSIGKYSDNIFAPFCIILGMNKNSNYNYEIKGCSWKTIAGKIWNNKNFMNNWLTLDYENISDSDILEAFVCLNLPELDYNVVKNYSTAWGKLIKWCQGVVSYHILIHPYIYRNESSQINSDIHEYAEQMNYWINRFYKFKRFIITLQITTIPWGNYVFNLQHSRTIQKSTESFKNFSSLDYKSLGFILSYIPYQSTYQYITINKKFKQGFLSSVDVVIYEILKEIYFFKINSYPKLANQISTLLEHNLFSGYFLMLDDILNSTCDNYGNPFVPFLTKDHWAFLRSIKQETKLIVSVCKVFCVICNIAPERRSDHYGRIHIDYWDKIKKWIICNQMNKTMRMVNKLSINETTVNLIKGELTQYYDIKVLEDIKKTNWGIYQLLMWELYVFEYSRQYNPFDFMDIEYSQYYDSEEVDMVKYIIEIWNYLKYNLKIKYQFSSPVAPIYGFGVWIERLKMEMNEKNMFNEILFESNNINYMKIANIYNQSKGLVNWLSKPAFYERIMLEIISFTNSEGENSISTERDNNNNYNKGSDSLENNVEDSGNKSKWLVINEEQTIRKANHFYQNDPRFHNKQHNIIEWSTLPNSLIIKSILFYLDITTLPLFNLLNKKCNECAKTHMFIRLFFLGKEKKQIEAENYETIWKITNKRNNFYKEYDISSPSVNLANTWINQITKEDLLDWKGFYKKYNKKYEVLISPFILLLGKKPHISIGANGWKTVSFFKPAQEMIQKKDFYKKIQSFQLETLPQNTFQGVEKLLQLSEFMEMNVKNYSKPIQHLIHWVKGVIEIHKVIRKYSLRAYDYNLWDENEILFWGDMDSIDLLYYKLLRYAGTYCRNYENTAKEIMKEMNISLLDD